MPDRSLWIALALRLPLKIPFGLWAKPTIRPLWKKPFYLTPRGMLLSFLSVGFFILGLVRAELATLLWSSGFLLLILYALLGNTLFRQLTRLKLKRDRVSCRLPGGGFFPGAESWAEIRSKVGRFPGFQIRYIQVLSWQNRPPIRIETDLHSGPCRRLVVFNLGKRGCYRTAFARLQFSDLLGFTCSTLELQMMEMVRVFPGLHTLEKRPPKPETGGSDTRLRPDRRNPEDFLELRKYFPGDDIRRINWKIYAHLDELFIRLGEQTPPPEARYLVVLDATNVCLPVELSGDYLDALVEACASLCELLLTKGLEIIFAGSGAPLTITRENMDQLLSLLSETWWKEAGHVELPAQDTLQVFLFSSPGSNNLAQLVSEMSSRSWTVNLYFQGWPAPEKRRRSFKEMLFLPGGTEPPRAKARKKREFDHFETSLAREVARYRHPPWRLKHVETL